MRFAQLARLILICYLLHFSCATFFPGIVKSSISQPSHPGLPADSSEIPVPCEGCWESGKIVDTDVKDYITDAIGTQCVVRIESRLSESHFSEFKSSRDLLTSINRLQI